MSSKHSYRGSVRTGPARAAVWTIFAATTMVALAGSALGQSLRIADADSIKYWIFFSDKQSTSPPTLKSVPQITDRALQRRQRRGTPQRPSLVDTPVSSDYVDALTRLGVQPVVSSRWLNAVSAYLDGPNADAVSRLPFVKRITPVGSVSSHTPPSELDARSVPRIPYLATTYSATAPASSTATQAGPSLDYGPSQTQLEIINAVTPIEAGIIGTGVIIGFLDTTFGGFSHPVFADMVADNRVYATQDFAVGAQTNTHGLSVASTAVGFSEGNLIGPAYGAAVLAATTEYAPSETNQEEDAFVAGLEWVEMLGADVVNSSLGYSTFDPGQSSYAVADLDGDTGITTAAFDVAAQLGVVVVTSAGNEGCASPSSCWYYVTMPADGDSVIAVGAVDNAGVRSSFSGRGPTADGRIKPDVAAPGGPVQVATSSGYALSGGTSFSAPLVTAVVAQMLQVNPDLTPSEVLEILRSTASQSTSPDNNLGWGIIDADLATSLARSVGRDPSETDEVFEIRSLFPNPASDETTLVLLSPRATEDVNLRVVDALGRTAMLVPDQRVTIGRTEIMIDTRALATGLYHIVLTTSGTQAVTTLLVVR